LGNIDRLSGGRDRTRLGHGDEMTDLTQGHHGELPVRRFYRFARVYIVLIDSQAWNQDSTHIPEIR
jgi:hypothetical protein